VRDRVTFLLLSILLASRLGVLVDESFELGHA
jgi:hypothetical protein